METNQTLSRRPPLTIARQTAATAKRRPSEPPNQKAPRKRVCADTSTPQTIGNRLEELAVEESAANLLPRCFDGLPPGGATRYGLADEAPPSHIATSCGQLFGAAPILQQQQQPTFAAGTARPAQANELASGEQLRAHFALLFESLSAAAHGRHLDEQFATSLPQLAAAAAAAYHRPAAPAAPNFVDLPTASQLLLDRHHNKHQFGNLGFSLAAAAHQALQLQQPPQPQLFNSSRPAQHQIGVSGALQQQQQPAATSASYLATCCLLPPNRGDELSKAQFADN